MIFGVGSIITEAKFGVVATWDEPVATVEHK